MIRMTIFESHLIVFECRKSVFEKKEFQNRVSHCVFWFFMLLYRYLILLINF